MLRMDGDGTRGGRTPTLVGAENDTPDVPIMLADARGQRKDKLSTKSECGGRGRWIIGTSIFLVCACYIS